MLEADCDLTIRRLHPADAQALRRLAERDSSRVPAGTILGAVVPGGALLAAISIESGKLVADPFARSEHAAGLLRMRRRQMRGEARRVRRSGNRRAVAALPASPPGAGGRLLRLSGVRQRS